GRHDAGYAGGAALAQPARSVELADPKRRPVVRDVAVVADGIAQLRRLDAVDVDRHAEPAAEIPGHGRVREATTAWATDADATVVGDAGAPQAVVDRRNGAGVVSHVEKCTAKLPGPYDFREVRCRGSEADARHGHAAHPDG